MNVRESRDAVYLFVLAFLAVVLAFLSITLNVVQRLYHAFAALVQAEAIDFFLNFIFLFLAGLILFYYRRWRVAELMRRELDDVVSSVDPDVLLVINQAREITLCNSAVSRMFGYTPKEVIGHKTDCLYKDRRTIDPHGREVYEALERDGFHVGLATGVRKDGTELPIEIITAVLRTGKGAVLLLRDITARRRAEENLIRSRDAYQSLYDEFPVPVRLSDAAGKSFAFNKAWYKLTGRTAEEESGDSWMEGVFPEDRERVVEAIERAVRDKSFYELVFRIVAAEGDHRWIIENGRFLDTINDGRGGFVSACYDITERIVQERQLSYLATHDPLTDLPNRILCLDRLKLAVADADRDGTQVSVIFLDLDNFKDINDRLGHRGGDRILKGVAERLKGCTRLGDTVARFGGDEFVVVLSGLETESQAAAVANRIHDSFSQPFLFQGNDVFVSASLGISFYPTDSGKIENLVSLADEAMYKAKAGGKNSCRFHADYLNRLESGRGTRALG